MKNPNKETDINIYTILKSMKDESKVRIISSLVDSIKRNYLTSTILLEQFATVIDLTKELRIPITAEDYKNIEKEFDYIMNESDKIINPFNSNFDADPKYVDYLLELNNRICIYNNYMNSVFNLIMESYNPEIPYDNDLPLKYILLKKSVNFNNEDEQKDNSKKR